MNKNILNHLDKNRSILQGEKSVKARLQAKELHSTVRNQGKSSRNGAGKYSGAKDTCKPVIVLDVLGYFAYFLTHLLCSIPLYHMFSFAFPE